jgi:hypothetical protein
MGAGAEGEDLETPAAPKAPEIPATPKNINQENKNIQDYDGQFPLMDEWERIHREEAENARGDYQVGKGAEGEHLETPATPEAPEIPATPKAPMGAGAEGEDLETSAAPKAPEIPATPKKSENQAEPKDSAEPKQTSYDEGKVREHIESIANESNRDLRKRIKEENKNKSGLSEDIAQKKAEFTRDIAKKYLTTKDPIEKAKLEQTFIGKIPGVSPKDHAQHLLNILEQKPQQSNKESYSAEAPTAIASATPNTEQKQEDIKSEVTAKTPAEDSSIVEPKTPESSVSSPASELTASTMKSGSELNAVRESAVEDRMLAQQSQQPIIVPMPVQRGSRAPQLAGSNDSSSDAMIPMAIVNDEEIIRMNSFEANKYRML